MSESAATAAHRIVIRLDGQGVSLRPDQEDEIREIIEDTEGQETIRVLTQILETLKAAAAANPLTAGKLDEIAAGVRALQAPIERVMTAEERSLNTRSDIFKQVVTAILSLATGAAAVYFGG